MPQGTGCEGTSKMQRMPQETVCEGSEKTAKRRRLLQKTVCEETAKGECCPKEAVYERRKGKGCQGKKIRRKKTRRRKGKMAIVVVPQCAR